jgi:hypothetical protein
MSAARSPYRRSDWYDAVRFDASLNNVLSERDEKRHGELRAKMAAGVGLSITNGETTH